jgi:hypothetical protein
MFNNACLNRYQIYGLTIHTTRSLPGLVSMEESPSPDVIVELVGLPQKHPIIDPAFWNTSPDTKEQDGFHLWKTQGKDGTYWRLLSVDGDDVLDFVLNPDGTQVWGFWSGDHLFQDAVSLLLGGVLGHLLRLRDSLCLHASVVAMNGGAIAIVGESGAGKSTLAAALSACGCAILSDDLAVISYKNSQFWVQSGYPYLRLWSNSLNALQVPTAGLSRVCSRLDKHFLGVATIEPAAQSNQGGFIAQALPLQAVYVLGERDALLKSAIAQPLSPAKALQHLLTHSYGRNILTKQQIHAEFQQLAAIAQTIPVRELLRPDDMSHLHQICQLLINFCGD